MARGDGRGGLSDGDRRCVLVLGGGAAGLAAAFELTATPELRDRFDVTVLAPGWRLGGKGASGRGVHSRIEEHGLHVWFGFYRNALRLMSECYAERSASGDDVPFRRLPDAFVSIDELVLCERRAGGRWEPSCLRLPDSPPPDESRVFSWLPAYLLAWVEEQWKQSGGPRTTEAQAAFAGAVAEAEVQATEPPDPARYMRIAEALDAVSRESSEELAATLPAFDLWTAFLATLAIHVLPRLGSDPAPFDHLNDRDLRALLGDRRLGPLAARPETLEAALVRVLYDLAFSYRAGQPDVAAGVALENMINIGARHSGRVMMKMRAGMGDVIFAPLYELLLARGVRFDFFSAAEAIEPGNSEVTQVRVVRQAGLREPPYRPLTRGKLPTWPAAPLTDQLDAESARLVHELPSPLAFERELDPLRLGRRETLRRGEHFEHVVAAIPIGSLKSVGAPLGRRDRGLAAMLADAEPVATQALQLWLSRGLDEVGWPCSGGSVRIAGAYAKPFDTFCDMSHLLATERWPSPAPSQVGYLCGVLDERQARLPPDRADEAVFENSLAFLEDHRKGTSRPFWDGFSFEDLVGGGGSPQARLRAQFWRANTAPAELYSASFAGRMASRLAAGETAFENLALAGDWTRTAVNAGSVEAAVMSGMEAARVVARREGAPAPPGEVMLPPWRLPAEEGPA